MAIGKKKVHPGDILVVERRDKLYFHYAVYVGNGRIIHYASDTGDWGEHIYIHEAPLKEFTHDVPIIKICTFPEDSTLPGYHLYSAEETVERARSRLGEEKYDLFFNNCEHFAVWCKTNISNCRQIPNIFRGTAANPIIQLCKNQIIPTFHLCYKKYISKKSPQLLGFLCIRQTNGKKIIYTWFQCIGLLLCGYHLCNEYRWRQRWLHYHLKQPQQD